MTEIVTAAAVVGGEVGEEVAAQLNYADDATRKKFTDDMIMVWWRLPEFFGQGSEKRERMRAALGEQFDALPLDQQRRLVGSLQSIQVMPGQGKKRVVIDAIQHAAAASA